MNDYQDWDGGSEKDRSMAYEMAKRFWLTHLGKRSNNIAKRNLKKASFYKWLAKITLTWKSNWIWGYAMAMQFAYSKSCDSWLENSKTAIDTLKEMEEK